MKIKTKKEKEIFNEGVQAACKELLHYDGVIQNEAWRKYVSEEIKRTVSKTITNKI